MAIPQKLLDPIEKYAKQLALAVAQARYWHDRAQEFIDREETLRREQLDAEYAHVTQTLKQNYATALQTVQAELAALEKGYRLAETDWSAAGWQPYTPQFQADIPRLVRLGELSMTNRLHDKITMPALLPVIGGRNVLLLAEGAGKERARLALQAMVLRLLGSLPPGKLRLVCIDPVGLGSNMAGFIKGLPDILTGGQAWFSQKDIEQKLVDLENHMAFVKQKYLGVSFASMEDYNAQAGQVEEAYRLLVIADFPARFTDTAAQHLLSIATNGPGTGVYLLAMIDIEQKLPYGINLDDLRRTAEQVRVTAQENKWLRAEFEQCPLTLDSPLPASDFERIVRQIGDAALSASAVRIGFDQALPPETAWWHGDSRGNVRVPIGRFGARETQYFTLNEEMLNSALAAGIPGSGKTMLLHVLIHGLAYAYSPDELELYLLDFKQVEFKDYALYRLPHARVVAVKSEREFGLSVLRGLEAELQRRKDLFGNLPSLSIYRDTTGRNLSRIVLIVDEFQELFSHEDDTFREAQRILDQLVRLGRAFGINVLLASQTLGGTNSLGSATKNQIPIRIALKCTDNDSRQILAEDNDRARLLERPGEAIYNATNGRVEGNNRFQVFYMENTNRAGYLQQLRAMADRTDQLREREPIVFDGDADAQVENNRELLSLLAQPGWPVVQRGWKVSAWLGEPIAIRHHTAAVFRRQSCSNLLVVGQTEYAVEAVGMLLTALLSLATQQGPQDGRFFVLDLTDIDAKWNILLEHMVKPLKGRITPVRRPNLGQLLSRLATEVQARVDQPEEAANKQAWYLVVIGLHLARELRRGNSDIVWEQEINSDEAKVLPAEQLATILRDGPDVGVHTLLWCDTLANFERVLPSRDQLDEFEMRVTFQMGAEDSRQLIDSESANRLGAHRALFYSQSGGQRIEKFRPYGLPAADWLSAQADILSAKK